MKPKLLIVDDEPLIREVLLSSIEGWEIEMATCGDEAIELLKTQRFDTILSDVQMPNGTGIDLLKFTMGLENPPKFIFMTGYGPLQEEHLSPAHVLGVAKKPFLDETLEVFLKKSLEETKKE